MEKIKNQIITILFFAAIFLFVNIIVYAQDTSRTSPGANSANFNDEALQLSTNLIRQTGLSQNKADKISKILIDYRNDIAEAKTSYMQNKDNPENNKDLTGGPLKVDMTGILGNNVEQYYKGAAPELMSSYREADRKADDNIKDVFDNSVQKLKYEQIKTQWWGNVKAKVFPSLEGSPNQPQK